MIKKSIQDNILNSVAKHIAFAVNSEGKNECGFAGQICKYWPELADIGEHEIGTVLSKTVGNRTFHALVCHSLDDGWGENQDEIIKECFDKIPASGEEIATIAIGTGFVGKYSGADFGQIICGMQDSYQSIDLYSSYSLDIINNMYTEAKNKKQKVKEKSIILDLNNSGMI